MMRINELKKTLSKDYGMEIDNKDLIARCQELGYSVSSHSSSIPDEDIKRVIEKLRKHKTASQKEAQAEAFVPHDVAFLSEEERKHTEEKMIKRGVIRRRKADKGQEAQSAELAEAIKDAEISAAAAEEAVGKVEDTTIVAEATQSVQPEQREATAKSAQESVSAQEAEIGEKPARPTLRKVQMKAEIISRPEVSQSASQTPGGQEARTVGELSADGMEAGTVEGYEDSRDKQFDDKKKKKRKKEAVESKIEIITDEGDGEGNRIIATVPLRYDEVSKPKLKAEIIYKPTAEESQKLGEDFRASKPDGLHKKRREKHSLRREISRNEIYDDESPLDFAGRVRIRRRKPTAKKTGQKTIITTPKASKRVVKMNEQITVGDLAQAMSVKSADVIKKLMNMGVIASLTQPIDYDTAAIVASDFEYEVQNVALNEDAKLSLSEEDKPEDLRSRPPVVTIMGHVDHGKTSLLDYIRKSNIAAGEAGAITQHIGAYQVETELGEVTFIDTPGHEAFTSMRARGAKTTDIVILVVAANDGIMPQTVEAIKHAEAAEVPIIVAVNKCDLPEANPGRVKQQLMDYNLVPEEYGGDTLMAEISAKTGDGIKDLLEKVMLQAELLELTANPYKQARGTVLEAKLDRGRGAVVTLLVQNGALKQGDIILIGQNYGRVRALINDKGDGVKEALPSMPVEILGLSGVPDAGEEFYAVPDERTAREIAEYRQDRAKKQKISEQKVNLEDLFEKMKEGEILELRLVIKADVQGSCEALKNALERIEIEGKAKVKVIFSSVGAITSSDVMLASASNAIIVGFHVRPDGSAKKDAEKNKVDMRIYHIIYDAVEEISAALTGMVTPEKEEFPVGKAEVRKVFNISKIGKIAGSAVIEGKIVRNSFLRLIRDNVQVFEGKITSLKREKNDVREVPQGMECGIGIEGCNDLKEGDIIEAYEIRDSVKKAPSVVSQPT